jgi:hypothetical protein
MWRAAVDLVMACTHGNWYHSTIALGAGEDNVSIDDIAALLHDMLDGMQAVDSFTEEKNSPVVRISISSRLP